MSPAAQAATQYCNGFKATIVGTSGNDNIDGTIGLDVGTDTVKQRHASDREEDRYSHDD